MKKYFIVSDVHSFYTEFRTGLKNAGYDSRNKEHILVICGDLFDRGEQTIELYNYLIKIPKSRLILIRGNHEDLYEQLLTKPFPDSYDFSNGTVKTFCHVANYDYSKFCDLDIFEQKRTWDNVIKQTVATSNITDFIKNKKLWNNFFELGKFICVHSFIPVTVKDHLPIYAVNNRKLEERVSWRTDATEEDWEDARWGCPWKRYKSGLFNAEAKEGKILICGHWHTLDFHINLDKESSRAPKTNEDIFIGKNIIAIDGGVKRAFASHTYKSILVHKQNVLVLQEDNSEIFIVE